MRSTLKSTLIAIAVGGALASSVAVAGTTSGRDVTGFTPVQYTQYQYDRQNDRTDWRSMNINEREAHLRGRIERGMNDGRITNREARFLLRRLERIEAQERSYMADGRLSRRENDELNRQLDNLAQNVRTQLRDNDRYSYNTR